MSDLAYGTPNDPVPAPSGRRGRGQLACLSGAMAEEGVERLLRARGMTILARRWRGRHGEIDLIGRSGACLVFVEVKQAATHAEAALRIGPAQRARILGTALEYCEECGHPPLSEMRFDVALVDRQGRIDLIQGAFDES